MFIYIKKLKWERDHADQVPVSLSSVESAFQPRLFLISSAANKCIQVRPQCTVHCCPDYCTAPISKRLWIPGPQSTVLQTSHRLCQSLGFGKSSMTVDNTLLLHRATLGNPGKKTLTGDSVTANLRQLCGHLVHFKIRM